MHYNTTCNWLFLDYFLTSVRPWDLCIYTTDCHMTSWLPMWLHMTLLQAVNDLTWLSSLLSVMSDQAVCHHKPWLYLCHAPIKGLRLGLYQFLFAYLSLNIPYYPLFTLFHFFQFYWLKAFSEDQTVAVSIIICGVYTEGGSHALQLASPSVVYSLSHSCPKILQRDHIYFDSFFLSSFLTFSCSLILYFYPFFYVSVR